MPKHDPRIPCEMVKALLQYEAEATKALETFVQTVEAKKPPPMLYHYTTEMGLRGILKAGTYGSRTYLLKTIHPSCDMDLVSPRRS